MVTDAGKRAFGISRHVTEATMRVRDVLYEGLLVRRGLELTEEVAREAANNLSMSAIEALAQLAEESKPPPVKPHWAEMKLCTRENWCGLEDNHPGDCREPF